MFIHRNRRAFTILELIIVISLITILSGMVLHSIHMARERGKSAACATNLRSLAQAALTYAEANGGSFPWGNKKMDGYRSWSWDFVVSADGKHVTAGAMWNFEGVEKVMQCPAFLGGNSNAAGEQYTGYNYNCSYIGKVEGDPGKRKVPAKLSQLKKPDRTALFGDGEFASGANKYMRAPKSSNKHDASGAAIREAGTQGFRHLGKTNIVFCDGHVESLSVPYLRSGDEGFVSKKCGFISPDNSLYSLE